MTGPGRSHVVFAASEGVPFSKTGGLADVIGALPRALAELGQKVSVILPRYRETPPAPVTLSNLTLPLAGKFHFADVQSVGTDGKSSAQHHLIDCPEFFDRPGLYGEKGVDYRDNAERFAAFSLACLEFLKRQRRPPSVIHCHDWQTALIPVYLRTLYRGDRFFESTSVVLTIHNLGYQGLFPPEILSRLSLGRELFGLEGMEFFGKVNLLKGGIQFSDIVTTVSPTYGREIQTPEFGAGLEGVLAAKAKRIQGILNGVDYNDWNPAGDPHIAARYSATDLNGKIECKKDLLETFGFSKPDLARPVLGIVSRFAAQKGFDLIAEITKDLMKEKLYLVALGSGEKTYESLFLHLAEAYPEKVGVRVAYDNVLAHKIEAGADMFLMPSQYEPCGLNQIYSMKYGTVPLVRATGGLEDTVAPFDGESGTGFKFKEYSGKALLKAIRTALKVYRDREAWKRLVSNGMEQDFSWTQSAQRYLRIYRSLKRAANARAKKAERAAKLG